MSEKRIVQVRDVMNDRYILVDGLDTVSAAFSKLKRNEARCIIVKKRSDSDEYGIVLLSDIARKIIAPDRSPGRVNIYEIMSKPVISVRPDMNIRYAVRLFDQFGIAVAPVIAQEEVIGVVTYTDFVLQGMSVNE